MEQRKYHFRKFSPIDREYSVFELVNNDTILLDVSTTDDGEIEVAFHEALSGKILKYDELQNFLKEGLRLAKEDSAE